MSQGKTTTAYRRWTRRPRLTLQTDSPAQYAPLAIALLASLIVASPATAQNVTPRISEIATSGAAALTTSTEKGVPFAELLISKGGNASYVLTKSNVLVDTLNVFAGGRILRLNQDYWFDSASSAIYLQINLSRYETISVDYRYLEKAPANATPSFLPNMRLNLGNKTQMGLTFGSAANNGAGLNISTYGLSLNSVFGAQNSSNYKSLMFFSNTSESDNMVLRLNPNEKMESKEEKGAGSLIVQGANYKTGNVSVRGGYQDVGTNFNGFKTLRSNYANDAEMLKEIALLEGERGIRRTSLGFGVSTGGKKNPAQGFQMDMSQIQDGKGSINRQSMGFTAQNFLVSYSARSVANDFQKFSGLRDDDKAQLAAEKGMKTSALGLGYTFGLGGKAHKTGGLDFSNWSAGDDKGGIRRMATNFKAGALGFSYSNRASDASFTRMKDLALADKNALLLDISRQFDSAYKAEFLTDVDRAQLVNEVGVSRNSLSAGLGLGTGTTLQVSQLSLEDSALSTPNKGLEREKVALTSKKIGVSYTRQSVGASFSKVANLTDMERGFLALDMLRGFNPNGSLSMITPIDKAQMSKAAGLTRNVLRLDGTPGKESAFSFSQMGIADASLAAGASPTAALAGMNRAKADLQARNFNISLLKRKSDMAFHRMGDLTDIEKTFLALDVRRLYDPAATPEQITPKEREQVAREVGISRNVLQANAQTGKRGKGGTLSLNQFSIASQMAPSQSSSSTANLRRETWNYADKKVKFSLLNQSIDSNFLRLPELSDVERQNLGNERGLWRQQLLLTWLANKNTQIGFQSLSVGSTPDSLLGGGAAAAPSQMSLNRKRATIDTKGLNLALGVSDISKSFARGSDLAIPDPEKPAIEMERGFKKYDYGLKFSPLKTLKIDTNEIWATNPDDLLGRTTYRHNLEFAPNKKLSLLFRANGDVATAKGARNGMETSFFSLSQILSKNLAFSWTKDQSATLANDAATQGARTDLFTLATPDTAKNPLKLQRKQVEFFDGKYENSSIINTKIKPAKSFSFGLSLENIERGEQGTEFANGLDFEWQAAKKFSVIAGVSHRDVQNPELKDDHGQGDVKVYTLGVKGEPLKDVTLAASFNEVHQVAANVKDVADISLCNAKPIKWGPFQDFVLTARYAALNDQRKMMNETMTGKASFKLWKNEFMLDYGGNIDKTGETIARTYFFSTDPDPKRSFKGSFYYKARTMLDGSEKTIRRFTASARLAKNTSFNYLFGTLQEDERLNVLPILTTDVALKHNIRKDLTFDLYYRLSDNSATRIMTRSLGAGFEGQLNKASKLTLTFSAEGNRWPDRFDNSNHLRLSLEQTLSANRFFSLSADIRSHDAPNVQDEVMATADLRIRF